MQDIKEKGKSQLDEVPDEMVNGSSEHLVSSTTADVRVSALLIIALEPLMYVPYLCTSLKC